MELLTKYTTEIREKLQALFAPQSQITTERCVIQIIDNEIYILLIDQSQDQVSIKLLEHLQFDNLENLPLVLSGLVLKHELKIIPTTWLLAPDAYQLLLIESLPVAEKELVEALSWRIRNLINYPIEEAVIDYFTIPPKKSSTQPMIAAVVAKSNDLKTLINIFEKCGIKLATIDIPELALRNLTALYEQDEKTTALIYFYDQYVILNITREKQLYFTRRIPITLNAETKQTNYEQLSLEIMRYFDFYQSQWRASTPTRVFVASNSTSLTDAAKQLAEYLLVPVEPFSLKPYVTDDNPELETKYLLPFGSALRKGDA